MFKPNTADFLLRRTLLFGLLAIILLLMILLSLCIGAVPVDLKTIITTLMDSSGADPILRQIIFDFRMPRILTAILAGASLATAGLMMQTLFRNPLADPYVLGVNSGASLGVAIVVLAVAPVGIQLTEQLNLSGQLLIIFAASGGAALTLFAVLLLSNKADIVTVLIIGLMISYAVGALVSILIFLSMAEQLQSFLSWSFGTYSTVNWTYMWTFAPVVICVLGISVFLVKSLDALLLGEHYAESIGTRTKRVRFFILLTASVLTGTVTGFCGPIGFLGIAAPHLSRYLFKTSAHKTLIPASIMTGALLSLSADFIAQGPGLDVSLPLNAITALFGAPLIIAALIQQRTLRHTFG